MNVKVHYRITQDRAGMPAGFRRRPPLRHRENQSIEDMAKSVLAADYQVPLHAVEICRVEH
jgi:hypothetical protein